MALNVTITDNAGAFEYHGWSTDLEGRIYPIRGYLAEDGTKIPSSSPYPESGPGAFYWRADATIDGGLLTLDDFENVKPTLTAQDVTDARLCLTLHDKGTGRRVATLAESFTLGDEATQDWAGVIAANVDRIAAQSPTTRVPGDLIVRDNITAGGDITAGGFFYGDISRATGSPQASQPALLTILLDRFLSPDGTSNHGRYPSNVNNPLSQWEAVTGTFVTVSGRLQPSTTSYPDASITVVDAKAADVTVSVVVTAYYSGSDATKSRAGLIFRYADEDNFWVIEDDPGTGVVALFEVTAGVYTQRGPTIDSLPSQQQGHLTVIAAGDVITWHRVGTEPQVYSGATAHQTATKVGVWAGKGSGTPGAVPTFKDFVAVPSFIKHGKVLERQVGGWTSNDCCAPSCQEWDEENQRYSFLFSGFDGDVWASGEAHTTNFSDYEEDPANPTITPIAGDGDFIAGPSRVIKADGQYYFFAYNMPGSDPSTDDYSFDARIIGFSGPTRTGPWERINGGLPVVPLTSPSGVGDGGKFDLDARRCTNGVWQIVFKARKADGSGSVIGFSEGTDLEDMSPAEQWNVFDFYGPESGLDIGQPTFDGNDYNVFSVTFERTHVSGVKRYLVRSDSYDGGASFIHVGMVLAKGESGDWDAEQVMDYSGYTLVGDTVHALYAGSLVAGGASNIDDDIGRLTAKWPVPYAVAPTDPAPGFLPLTDGATITVDASKRFSNRYVTLTDDSELIFENLTSGAAGNIFVTQGGAGGHELAVPAGSKVADGGGGILSLSTTAGREDLVEWIYKGGALYFKVTQHFS